MLFSPRFPLSSPEPTAINMAELTIDAGGETIQLPQASFVSLRPGTDYAVGFDPHDHQVVIDPEPNVLQRCGYVLIGVQRTRA